MNSYRKIIVCLSLLIASFANAAFYADCTETKYNAMGTGWGSGSDYMMVGEYSGFTPSYSVLKFDISGYDSIVEDSVYLKIEKYSNEGAMFADTSSDNIISIGARAALSDISGWSEFNDSQMSDVVSDTQIVGSDGFYYFDVTDIVNGWIVSGENNGLVLAAENCPSGNSFSYLYGIGNSNGAAPILTAVPEPATIAFMSLGLLTALGKKKK